MLSSNGVSSFSSVFGKEHTRARFEISWILKDTLVDYINENAKQDADLHETQIKKLGTFVRLRENDQTGLLLTLL